MLTQRVGCDLKIGSTQHVDECGVCGGNGSSCARPMYKWQDAETSLCSATCGGGLCPNLECDVSITGRVSLSSCVAGFRMTRPVCVNRVTKTEEDDAFCNPSQKPQLVKVACNNKRCPPKYEYLLNLMFALIFFK